MNKKSILSQMLSKSLHLKGIYFQIFFRSEGAHPLRLPRSKELSNKNTTLFFRKLGTRKGASIKTKVLSKMGIKHFFLHSNAYFHYFLQFWGSTSLIGCSYYNKLGHRHKITPPNSEDALFTSPFTFYIHFWAQIYTIHVQQETSIIDGNNR